MVGGVTGVATGIAVVAFTGGSDGASQLGRDVADKAPGVADRLADAAERRAARLHEADLPGRAEELVRDVARQVG